MSARERISVCPVDGCGEEIQATVPVYLDGIVFERDDNGDVRLRAAHSTGTAFGGDAFDAAEARYYCANDHDVVAELLRAGETFHHAIPFLARLVARRRHNVPAGRGGRL